MAAVATLSAMNSLVSSEGGSLSGLELDKVAENYVNSKYGTDLDKIEDANEKNALKNKWLNYYKNGEGKENLQSEINAIKLNYGCAKEQITAIIQAAPSVTSAMAIPSVLTVGTATSTANPGWTSLDNKVKKAALLCACKSAAVCLMNCLKSAASIDYDVPGDVTALIAQLNAAKSAVNSIPG